MNILVVSPHQDDETLGAGGTLLKYKKQGNKIYWLNITSMKHEYGYSDKEISNRKKQVEKVNLKYNFNKMYNLELCPSKLDTYESKDIINKIFKIMQEIEPEILILPNNSDIHSDHKITFDWCYSCTKIFRMKSLKKILMMEILSETDFAFSDSGFLPNYFIDISNEFSEKINVINIYGTEMGKHPFPRSIEAIDALAKYRGVSAGCKYAEAFKVVKIIE